MTKADYIILGAGASGLMLAYRMANDSFFNNKSIVILDKEANKGNDRTWCYWEDSEGEWDSILTKSWHKIYFGSSGFSKEYVAEPYSYKMIRSANFYDFLWESIKKQSNIKFVSDTIIGFNDQGEQVIIEGASDTYEANKVFNSTHIGISYQNQDRYPVLKQHFLGWFIKLNSGSFDDYVATFMDFDLAQNGNTRFMYVLPISRTEALFEYTLFSKDLLDKEEYENAINEYLEKKGFEDYEILEKEYGSIPMTSFKFHNNNSANLLHIGTAGGWTKASTGYTFMSTTKKTKALVNFLKVESNLSKFHRTTKFWYYDLLLLDVLSKHNGVGSKLFSSLFKKTNLKTIFRFLDEESSILEDLKIITSVPSGQFISALIKRVF